MAGNQLWTAILGIRKLFFPSRRKLLDRSQLEVWELSAALKTSSIHKAKALRQYPGRLHFSDCLLRCSLVPKWSHSKYHRPFPWNLASFLMPASFLCCVNIWRFGGDFRNNMCMETSHLENWSSEGMQAMPSSTLSHICSGSLGATFPQKLSLMGYQSKQTSATSKTPGKTLLSVFWSKILH